jgi:4'-phosphopantetheinyl transferase
VPPRLGEHELHVWRRAVLPTGEARRALVAVLSPDEQRRADLFHFDADRERYILTRGTLRLLLAQYLGANPAQLRFVYGARGKPALADPDSRPLAFNVSHTRDMTILAFAWNRSVGVDVEANKANVAVEDIAQRFFSPAEVQALLSLPPDERAAGFLDCWTRKEAFIKARGDGLHFPLDAFAVTLGPRLAARFLHGVADCWKIAAFSAGSGHVGAVVFDGAAAEIAFFTWAQAA